MRRKAILHPPLHCERCGHDVTWQRAGRFRDEDFYELLHEYFVLERRVKLWKEMHAAQRKEFWALMDQFIALDVERYQRILDEATTRITDQRQTEDTEDSPF